MGLALLDCPTGLAGNMLLAALLDLGVPEEVIHRPLAALGYGGAYALEITERRSAGLRGLHLEVLGGANDPPPRTWQALRRCFEQAAWPEALRSRVIAVFTLLAEAEAAVHGHAPEQVHFHEVGALDALVDVVGVCAGLSHLGIDRLESTPPPAGHGTVSTAHGTLPVPAPAVLEMARRRAIPLASAQGFPPAELTTPTGLALAACWADRFALPPAHVPRQVGVGLGSRELDRPNLLRLVLAETLTPEGATQPLRESLLVQQAQIDDATPEDLAALQDRLRQGGALEVFCQPIVMKKGRPAWLVTALVPLEAGERLRALWWRHSTSLGLREQVQQRWVLPRRALRLETPLGPVRLKQALLPDGRWRGKPEHEDLLQLAAAHDLALDQVRAVVNQALLDPGTPAASSWDDAGDAASGVTWR
ncbi:MULTISPECIES: nickel pincer cofactor biosynthesis protein LarC [Aphanothece]|uniref:nickel pincer cofactor biosynthesis protein LarC n=1 Tax=Aphanothece TaxID=1121 RepID=UPI00398516CA